MHFRNFHASNKAHPAFCATRVLWAKKCSYFCCLYFPLRILTHKFMFHIFNFFVDSGRNSTKLLTLWGSSIDGCLWVDYTHISTFPFLADGVSSPQGPSRAKRGPPHPPVFYVLHSSHSLRQSGGAQQSRRRWPFRLCVPSSIWIRVSRLVLSEKNSPSLFFAAGVLWFIFIFIVRFRIANVRLQVHQHSRMIPLPTLKVISVLHAGMQATEDESLCFKKPQSRFFFRGLWFRFISITTIELPFCRTKRTPRVRVCWLRKRGMTPLSNFGHPNRARICRRNKSVYVGVMWHNYYHYKCDNFVLCTPGFVFEKENGQFMLTLWLMIILSIWLIHDHFALCF